MQNNNHNGLNQLINYYQKLININGEFVDIHDISQQNQYYENLLKQLLIIRNLLIKKETSNINAVYRPIEKLFNNKEHFNLLEATVSYFKQNPALDYKISAVGDNIMAYDPQIANKNEPDLEQDANEIRLAIRDELNAKLGDIEDKILTKIDAIGHQTNINQSNNEIGTIVSVIQALESAVKPISSDDFNAVVVRSTRDVIATLNTNYELMKDDIKRYDAMLTDHINKSGINTIEAIEKEHARFVQKIASESNSVISGITNAAATEISKQSEIVQSSVKSVDNKLFKYFSIMFFMSACFMFGGALLSSNWAVNKFLMQHMSRGIEVANKTGKGQISKVVHDL